MSERSASSSRLLLLLPLTLCFACREAPIDLVSLLPKQVSGHTLTFHTYAGTQIADPKSDDWNSELARLHVSASDLSLAVSDPPADPAGLPAFYIAAFRVAHSDWAPRVTDYLQLTQSGGTVSMELITLAGKSVYRATDSSNPSPGSLYYYLAGDVLFFLATGSEAEAAEALGQITATAGNDSASTQALNDLGPHTLMLTLIAPPYTPSCVGEQPGRQSFQLLITQDFMPTSTFITADSALGRTVPVPIAGLGMATFYYTAFSWSSGQGDHLAFNAMSAVNGVASPPLFFFQPVQQCLNGLWREDSSDRTMQLGQRHDGYTAKQVLGAQTCGAPGLSFSGTLNGDQLSGSDLVVCNPEECVSAGLLENTTYASYTGSIDDSGGVLQLSWDDPTYTLVYDEMNNLTACTQSGTAPGPLTFARVAFGPDLPFP